MIPFMFEMSHESAEHMQLMLYPMYISGVSILQPWPAEESRLKVVVRPFDGWVSVGLNRPSKFYFRSLFIHRKNLNSLDKQI